MKNLSPGERLDWLRNRAISGSLKTRGCLFLWVLFFWACKRKVQKIILLVVAKESKTKRENVLGMQKKSTGKRKPEHYLSLFGNRGRRKKIVYRTKGDKA